MKVVYLTLMILGILLCIISGFSRTESSNTKPLIYEGVPQSESDVEKRSELNHIRIELESIKNQ